MNTVVQNDICTALYLAVLPACIACIPSEDSVEWFPKYHAVKPKATGCSRTVSVL